jgi:hypothetical protein
LQADSKRLSLQGITVSNSRTVRQTLPEQFNCHAVVWPPPRLGKNAGTVATDVLGYGDFVYKGFMCAQELHFNSGQSPTLHSLLLRLSQCLSNQVSLREKEEYKNPGNEGA